MKCLDVYSWSVGSAGPVSTKKTKTLMTDLKSKYADKSWSETLQLVRRCLVRKLAFRNSVSKDENAVVFSPSLCHVCLCCVEQKRRYLQCQSCSFQPRDQSSSSDILQKISLCFSRKKESYRFDTRTSEWGQTSFIVLELIFHIRCACVGERGPDWVSYCVLESKLSSRRH